MKPNVDTLDAIRPPTYFLRMRKYNDGRLMPDAAFCSRHDPNIADDGVIVRRRLFEPLAQADRFHLVKATWAPEAVLNHSIAAGRSMVRCYRDFDCASESYRQPRSFVDVPPKIAVELSYPSDNWPLVTRAEAFKVAAEQNRAVVESFDTRRIATGASWFVVVELGRLACDGHVRLDLEGRVGIEAFTGYRPVRLCKPTASERRRFALPAARALAS